MKEKMMNLLEVNGTLEAILGAILVLAIGLLLIKLVLKILRKTLEKTTLDESIYAFFISAVRIVLYIVLVVVLLSQLNVPTTPIVTMLGAGGAAIALALKDSLGNIAGGMLILVNQPFKKGDVIDVAGINGMVEHIDLFVTTMKTFDNKIISIPNGTINTSIIVNYSKAESRRVDCQFGIHHEADLNKAKDVLRQVAASNELIYTDPEPFVGVSSNRGGSVRLDLKVWCDTDKYWEVKYFLEEEVKLAFDEANVSILYPQMDVTVVQ